MEFKTWSAQSYLQAVVIPANLPAVKEPGEDSHPCGATLASRRLIQVALFFLCFFTFLFTYNARLGSVDGAVMYEMTSSLVERGSVSVNSDQWGREGVDGRYYSKYGPLQSIMAVPLYFLGRCLAPFAPGGVHSANISIAAVALFNPFVCALLASAIFGLAFRLGLSIRRSVVAALLFAFGTPAWYYSKTFFSEPLTALWLVLAFSFMLDYRRTRSDGAIFAAGLTLALAVATRQLSVVVAPVYLALAFAPGYRAGRSVWFFLVPLVVVGLSLAVYNCVRFGSALDSGYRGEGFTTPFHLGVCGLLASPRCGILFYSPLMLLAAPGLPRLASTRLHEALGIAGIAGFWFVAVTMWWCWWGGGSWGPRLLLPVFPFLTIAAVLVLPPQRQTRRFRSLAVVLVAALSVAVQLPGILVTSAWWEYGVEVSIREQGGDRFWDPKYMPLAWQSSHLRDLIIRRNGAPEAASLGDTRTDPSRKLRSDGAFAVDAQVLKRADMHVVDAWPSYMALLGISPRLICAALAALAAAWASALALLIISLRRMLASS
ncbi:MAG: ArnT family glycosyltransferase [Actinomycetota bacterium]